MQLQKNEEKKKGKKNVTRFGFLDGCQHSRRRKSGSNCLKTEEEPHKLGFNLPTMKFLFLCPLPPTKFYLSKNQPPM